MSNAFTLLDGPEAKQVQARLDGGRVRIPASDVEAALGWKLQPEGLCREGACVPVRDRAALVADDGLDLAALAALLDRPLALDADSRCAALGAGHAARAAALATLEAPDFELPDLAGRPHTLREQRGKKVLLVAYASW